MVGERRLRGEHLDLTRVRQVFMGTVEARYLSVDGAVWHDRTTKARGKRLLETN